MSKIKKMMIVQIIQVPKNKKSKKISLFKENLIQ
jgi:hypothetical protein